MLTLHAHERSGWYRYISLKFLCLVIMLGFFPACQMQTDNRDLEMWITEINRRPAGRVEPLPEIVTTRPPVDRELNRDPFTPLD